MPAKIFGPAFWSVALAALVGAVLFRFVEKQGFLTRLGL